MEPDGLLSCSQEPISRFHPQPEDSTTHPHPILKNQGPLHFKKKTVNYTSLSSYESSLNMIIKFNFCIISAGAPEHKTQNYLVKVMFTSEYK
jgi:hypothetical protein